MKAIICAVATAALLGCTEKQRVFDKELFIACVEAAGQQDDVEQEAIWECRSAATDYVEVRS